MQLPFQSGTTRSVIESGWCVDLGQHNQVLSPSFPDAKTVEPDFMFETDEIHYSLFRQA